MAEKFEIRAPDGAVKLTSPLPNGGYSSQLLRQMELDGYRIFIDGKRKTKTNKEDVLL